MKNEECCEACRSFSGTGKNKGWCMRLRKSTKTKDMCPYFRN